MPNKNTPPKHKTPNYKLVTHTYLVETGFPSRTVKRSYSAWEPVPLRPTRGDV